MLLCSLSEFVGPSLNLFLHLPVKCPPVLLMHSWWIHLQQLDRCFRCPLTTAREIHYNLMVSQELFYQAHMWLKSITVLARYSWRSSAAKLGFWLAFLTVRWAVVSTYYTYVGLLGITNTTTTKKALEKRKFTLWWASLQWCWLISFG